MRELRDRWVLPVSGHVVDRCCFGHDLEIVLAAVQGPDVTIQISAKFVLVDAVGRRWPLRPDAAATALAPVLGLIGLNVDRAEAMKDGTLEIMFADGISVNVPPDPDYEAWEFTGERGAKLISLPGGDVAVWKSAA